MADKEKEKEKEQEQQAPAHEQPKASEHQSLVDALKHAFAPKDSTPEAPKIGMDETIVGGKYIVRGTLVNAHGEPIDEHGKKLRKDE